MLAMSLVAIGVTTPATAEDAVGYVRLAHLSPDTPKVDVYLSKVGDGSFTTQVFPHVGYGTMSKYLALPVGTYAVAMRTEGAPASSPPVLTTQVWSAFVKDAQVRAEGDVLSEQRFRSVQWGWVE